MKVDDFDKERLQKAIDLLEGVYCYYYGSTEHKRFNWRLDTIVKKLDELIAIAEDKSNGD